jgi:hypothetical protein
LQFIFDIARSLLTHNVHSRERDPEAAPTVGASIDLATVGASDASTLASAEHKALGYRPPPGSLAAVAQEAAAQHPDASAGVPADQLAEAGRDDAPRIKEERGDSEVPDFGPAAVETPGVEIVGGLNGAGTVGGVTLDSVGQGEYMTSSREMVTVGAKRSRGADTGVNLDTITTAEARELQSEEQKMCVYFFTHCDPRC